MPIDALGQGVEGPVTFADEDVAGVGALRDGGEDEARIEFGGQVLERMNGEVDAALGERVFDLLDEDSFAARSGASAGAIGAVGLLHAVAGGADDLDLDRVAAVTQLGGDVVGLPEGELRASRADADGFGHVWDQGYGIGVAAVPSPKRQRVYSFIASEVGAASRASMKRPAQRATGSA